jgi:hypothetical protein
MEILALPGPSSNFYPVSSKDLFQTRQRRLLLVRFADQSSKVISDQLIHGCVAIKSDFSSSA